MISVCRRLRLVRAAERRATSSSWRPRAGSSSISAKPSPCVRRSAASRERRLSPSLRVVMPRSAEMCPRPVATKADAATCRPVASGRHEPTRARSIEPSGFDSSRSSSNERPRRSCTRQRPRRKARASLDQRVPRHSAQGPSVTKPASREADAQPSARRRISGTKPGKGRGELIFRPVCRLMSGTTSPPEPKRTRLCASELRHPQGMSGEKPRSPRNPSIVSCWMLT